MSVLVTGSVAIDTIRTPRGERREVLGGSATHFACAAGFFLPVRLVGVVGEDFPKRFLKVLASFNADLRGLEIRKGAKTFRWAGRYEGSMNEAQTTDLQLNVLGETPPPIPPAFRDSRCVFLANTIPAIQIDFIRQLRAPKLIVGDTRDHWIEDALPDLRRLLKMVHGFVLNDGEARMLTGEANMVAAAKSVLKMGPEFVVVKKGEHGAILASGQHVAAMPGFPIHRIVDPTGAGDSFAGGMLGHLASCRRRTFARLKEAMAYGTVVASLTIEGFGLEGLRRASRRDVRARLSAFRRLLAV